MYTPASILNCDRPMKSDRYYVCVYVKPRYHYSDKEELLETMSRTNHGWPTGSGTDLQTGKRDMGFAFPDLRQAKRFLSRLSVREVIESYRINRIQS